MKAFPIFAVALLALSPNLALADNRENGGDEDAASAAVTAFMDGFNVKDADTMSALVVDGAIVSVVEEREGEDRMRVILLQDLISGISSAPGAIEEPIWNMITMQEGPVATVVARFEFLMDGMQTHCGTNIFSLVRVDGEWKIASITYSHIEEDCLAAPTQ